MEKIDTPMHILAYKLKEVKTTHCRWAVAQGKSNKKIKETEKRLSNAKEDEATDPQNAVLMRRVKDSKETLTNVYKEEESLMRQKSRI